MGVSQSWGYPFGGFYKKDHRILGSMVGSPYLGNYHMRMILKGCCKFRRGIKFYR